MHLGRLCQTILKSDQEISGYGQLAQYAIFACHMVRQTPLIALPPAALLWLEAAPLVTHLKPTRYSMTTCRFDNQ